MCEDFSFKKPLKIPSLEWRKPSPSAYANAGAFIKEIPMLSNFLFSDFEGDKIMARLIVDKLLSNPELMTRESYDEINENLKNHLD